MPVAVVDVLLLELRHSRGVTPAAEVDVLLLHHSRGSSSRCGATSQQMGASGSSKCAAVLL